MQLYEGIRVEPVAPGAMPALDDDDVGIRVLDHAVDEPNTHCAGTDDEIVGFELTLPVHALTLTPKPGGRDG